jgi:hypothetical protein
MTEVLGDRELYRFTGGRPPTEAQLRARYARQVAGRSPDGTASWRNWVVRRRADGVVSFSAHVHPGHAASMAVARSLGMAPTEEMRDGEVLWRVGE